MFSDIHIFKNNKKKTKNKRIKFQWNEHLYRVNERTLMKKY